MKYTLFFYGGHFDFWTFNHQTLQSQSIASSAPHWIERPLQWIHQHHGYNVFNHFIIWGCESTAMLWILWHECVFPILGMSITLMFLTGSCSHSLTVQCSFWWSLPSSSSSSTTRSSSNVHGWQPQTRGHSSPALSSVCTAQPGSGHH